MKNDELKAELRKRGRSVGGIKFFLIERLLEAVNSNVPILENAVARHESMNGLDVTAEWIPLTKNPIPVMEPNNEDAGLRPPTERDAPINPKFEFNEEFTRIPFSGTTKNMGYINSKRSPRKSSQRHILASRHREPPPEPRKCGGPSHSFLKRYNLNDKSHPIEWFTALCPLTPGANKEDAAKANVTGDHRTPFSVSNLASYSNTKASLVKARPHLCWQVETPVSK